MTRFTRKEILSLLLLYLVGVGGLVWWVDVELRASASRMSEQMARMIGHEVAATLQSGMPDRVPPIGSRRHAELIEAVREIAERSALVESVDLVGPDGRVMATDTPGRRGRERPTPEELFGDDTRARLVDASGVGLHAGHYAMEVPLLDDAGRPIVYLTLTLASEELAELYHDRRRRVFVLGAVALGVIGLLGFLLHLQLAARGRRLRRALDEALAGRELPLRPPTRRRPDPFAEALAAAGRVGRELRDARRRSEQVEQRLAQLGEVLDVGVVLLGPERGLDFASPRARELLGLGAGEAGSGQAGPDVEATLPPELLEGVDRSWTERASGRVVEVTVQARAVQTERGGRRLRCQVLPLDQEDCVGWLVLVRDATLLRLLEIDLRRAARLRVLSQVYLAVAHDLKAPLNGMVLNLELLRESLAGGDGSVRDKQRRWVEVLERELGRLRRSLEALLAQTAPVSERIERFDLREMIGEIEELLAPQARQQKVLLDTALPGAPIEVEVHRDHLKQAVINVALNGLEVAGSNGRVEITLGTEAGAGNPGVAVIAVRDTGPGVPPELSNRIFDMHFTTKDSGTGIGLYVARSIVEGEGGALEIADTGPEGTTFAFRLPLTEPGDDAEESPA